MDLSFISGGSSYIDFYNDSVVTSINSYKRVGLEILQE